MPEDIACMLTDASRETYSTVIPWPIGMDVSLDKCNLTDPLSPRLPLLHIFDQLLSKVLVTFDSGFRENISLGVFACIVV